MNTYNIDNISHLSGKCMATVGMFDGVHVGHRHIVELLGHMANERGLTPLIVTFDRHPRLVLGKVDGGFGLLSTAAERQQLLQDAGARNVVLLHFDLGMASLSACQFLANVLVARLGVRSLLLGYDNQFGSHANDDFALLPQAAASLGVELLTDSAVSVGGVVVSSTRVRSALSAGNIELASTLLGRRYTIIGRVRHGRSVGRTIGFPTANLDLAEDLKVIPAEGVYATVAHTAEGQSYAAMVNIGAQPTFGLTTKTVEANLIDFSGDLYDQQLSIEFVRRLRDIATFDSPEALRRQLETDRKNTLLCTNN